MINNRTEIEHVLMEGKKILLERPELAKISIHDVINELDDGTQEMIHNRWGVAAWLVVNSVKEFDILNMINYLSEINSGLLTYEYSGYLLQNEVRINLEELLLEADKCGKFDKIVLYVSANLIYEAEFYENNFKDMLNMMEKHVGNNNYYSLLDNYSKHIIDMQAQYSAAKMLGNLDGQAQYDFMYIIRWSFYQKDIDEVDKIIGRMLQRRSIWSKKIAIDFLEVSLNYGIKIFQTYFANVKETAERIEEIWLHIIPVYIKYIIIAEVESECKLCHIYDDILKMLQNIPEKSLRERHIFIEALYREEEYPEELKKVFDTILEQSFNQDSNMLKTVEHYLYLKMKKKKFNETLQIMFKVFKANNYFEQYQEFFNSMTLLNSSFLPYIVEITEIALSYIVSGGLEQLFFGLGLLKKYGNLQKVINWHEEMQKAMDKYTDEQLMRIEKGVLYYEVIDKRICNMAFQLLEFCKESGDLYKDFCMNEVYPNYPMTMYEVAKCYKNAVNKKQAHLAEIVSSTYSKMMEEGKVSYGIKDLLPSKERQYIFHRAQMERNKQMNMDARKNFILGQFFNERTLKYGKRNAHIKRDRKDEKVFEVSPFMHHKYEMEIPAIYVKDPVEYELKRRAFLEEVQQDAIGNKRLLTSTEGKG